MSVMLSATNCLDWVCSITGNSIDQSLKNAESFFLGDNNVANAPYFLPYLSGERTPHNDAHVRGSFHYLKTTTNQGALQYAVLEGISFGILDGVNSIKSVNDNFDDIFMVGGGSQSSFWLKLLSTILNRKLSVCEHSEFGAALGVARLAMFADKNILNKKSIIKGNQVQKYFNSDNDKVDIFQKRYDNWKNIYFSNKKISTTFS
jgi:xylulokinase